MKSIVISIITTPMVTRCLYFGIAYGAVAGTIFDVTTRELTAIGASL
jgi:hypothetical protein